MSDLNSQMHKETLINIRKKQISDLEKGFSLCPSNRKNVKQQNNSKVEFIDPNVALLYILQALA